MMNIEELEEQLRTTLQRVEVIKQEIERLKQEQSKPLLWKPVKGQGYLYPSFDTYFGKFTSHYRHRIEAELEPIIAFTSKDQCGSACREINRLMPMIQFAIEENIPCSFTCSDQGNFHFYFNSYQHRKQIFRLWNQIDEVDN